MAEEINDLNESIRQLTAAISEMAGTFDSVAGQSKTASDNLNKMSAGAKNADANVNNMARATISSKGALNQFNTSTQEATEKQYAYKAAMASGIDATLGFTDSLLSTEKGFTKFSGALSSAGDAALSLGKSQGPVGEMFGRIVKAGTMVAELALKQADSLLTSTDAISKIGAANAFTAEEVRQMGRGAGLTSETLDKLIKPMTSMGGALKVLGGSSTEAAATFASMNNVTKETRESFQRLGLDDEQRIEATADYVQLMFKSGTALSSQQKTQENLIKQTKAYTENLFVLADLSGTDIETAQKNLEVTSSTIEVALANNKYASERGQLEQRLRDDAQTLADQEKQGINERIAQIEAEKKGLDDLNLALSTMNLAPAEKAAFQLEYLTGAVTSTAGGLLASGINISDLNEQLRNGTITVGEFQDAVLTSKQAAYDQFGDAIALSKDFQDTLNITAEGVAQVTQETQNRLEGNSRAQVEEAARARIAANEAGEGPSATDPAQVARNFMTETERSVQLFVDDVLAKNSPLMNGFNNATIASTALAAAAAAAAVALGAIALKRGAGSIFGGGGGKGGGGAPDIPDSASKAVTGLGTGLRSAGMGAVQIALGGAAIGAAIAAIGAGIAGAAWLTGKALPTFVEGLESFEELNGGKLVDASKGMVAIGAALAVMGTGAGIGGVLGGIGALFSKIPGASPIEQLKEFQSYDLDAPKITKNAEAITAYSNAMSAMGGIGGGLSSIVEAAADGILGMFGKSRAEIPWDKMKAFGEITLPTEKIKANSEAVTAYAIAMAKLTTVNGLESFGSMASGIFDGIGEWARGAASLPWDDMMTFAGITFPDTLKTNTERLGEFGEALSKMPEISVRREGGVLGTIATFFSGDVKMPWDALKEFSEVTLDDTQSTNIIKNAELLGKFGEAVSKVPEIPTTTTSGGKFDAIATFFSGDVQMPWDTLREFSEVTFTDEAAEKIVANANILKVFGEALSTMPQEIKGIEIDGGLLSNDLLMPWDLMKEFSSETFEADKIAANSETLKLFGESLSTIPEISITFSEESKNNFDRLTESLDNFSRLHSDDILKNIDMLQKFENIPSLAMSTATTATGTQTPDQTVTRITPAPVASNTTPGSTAPVVTTQTTAASTNTETNDIMTLLSYKLDNVISLLETGVTIQDRILLESRS